MPDRHVLHSEKFRKPPSATLTAPERVLGRSPCDTRDAFTPPKSQDAHHPRLLGTATIGFLAPSSNRILLPTLSIARAMRPEPSLAKRENPRLGWG